MRAIVLIILGFILALQRASASEQWQILGRVLDANTKAPLAGQVVVLRKLHHPWWCLWCLGGYRLDTSAKTDESGRFEFLGSKNGYFEVAVSCPADSTFDFADRLPVDTGKIKKGQHVITIEYDPSHCKFAL